MLPFYMFLFMIISLIFLIYFDYNPKGKFHLIFKTLTSVFFILICITSFLRSETNFTYFILLLIAFVFSLFGDVFLALYDRKKSALRKFFILGVISFAIAHVFFSIAFLILSPLKSIEVIVFILISLCTVTFLKLYKKFDFNGLFKIVVFYDIIISFMITKAIFLYPLINTNPIGISLLITGAILFVVSDLLLSFIYFYKKHPSCFSALNLCTYYIGQGLIALSIIGNL